MGRAEVDCRISVRGGRVHEDGMWDVGGGDGVVCLERYRCDIIVYTDSSHYYYNMTHAPGSIILLHKSRSWLNIIF